MHLVCPQLEGQINKLVLCEVKKTHEELINGSARTFHVVQRTPVYTAVRESWHPAQVGRIDSSQHPWRKGPWGEVMA